MQSETLTIEEDANGPEHAMRIIGKSHVDLAIDEIASRTLVGGHPEADGRTRLR